MNTLFVQRTTPHRREYTRDVPKHFDGGDIDERGYWYGADMCCLECHETHEVRAGITATYLLKGKRRRTSGRERLCDQTLKEKNTMDNTFLNALLARHTDDCAEETVAVVAILARQYGWSPDVRADVARAVGKLVCVCVSNTAALLQEIEAAK